MRPTFSIIIPVVAINDYLEETVEKLLQQGVREWELFIVVNEWEDNRWRDPRIRILYSGRVSPGRKRDLGAENANGEYLVFLDDDSYPESDYLVVALFNLKKSAVKALGGPAITPLADSFWQKVSGATFLSRFTGGAPERYLSIGSERLVDDWPTVNLVVERQTFLEIGGFDCDYWPGEDTLLCLKLLEIKGCKILYVPNMIVWHHRRSGFLRHLKQVANYGLHRGYFFKCFPGNSRRFKFLLPSFFFFFACISALDMLVSGDLSEPLLAGWIIYVLSLMKGLFDIRKHEKYMVALCAIAYIFPSHLVYGYNFIRGLFIKHLRSSLR